jgi:hypothetical protein
MGAPGQGDALGSPAAARDAAAIATQVNMSGSPLDPRIISSKACLATFSTQYVEGIDTLFANKGQDPYFVNKRNSTEKVRRACGGVGVCGVGARTRAPGLPIAWAAAARVHC